MKIRYKHYNERLDYIFEQEKKGNVVVIAPSENPGVGRTTRTQKSSKNYMSSDLMMPKNSMKQ